MLGLSPKTDPFRLGLPPGALVNCFLAFCIKHAVPGPLGFLLYALPFNIRRFLQALLRLNLQLWKPGLCFKIDLICLGLPLGALTNLRLVFFPFAVVNELFVSLVH